MSWLQNSYAILIASFLFFFLISTMNSYAQEWNCEVLPAERKIEVDEKSGAEITFITTNKSNDTNLYFHDNCWLFDGRIMLFNSDRTGR